MKLSILQTFQDFGL